MMGFRELKSWAEAGLAKAGALAAEIVLESSQYDLTRFAEGQVHQNISMDGVYVTARVFSNGRQGEAFLSAPTVERVKEAVSKAADKLQFATPGPQRPMPGPQQAYLPEDGPLAYDEAVAEHGTEWRTNAARQAINIVEGEGPRAFGRAITEVGERLVMNTEGLVSYRPKSGCDLSLTTIRDTGYGYSERHGFALDHIDIESAALEAATRCNEARDPRPLPAGEYAVILLPYAASDIVSFLARLGGDGEAIREGRSFMSGRIGEQVVSDRISLWDDGSDPAGRPLPFDGEGVAKQRVDMLTGGVAKGGVYTQATAAAEDRASTGHAPVRRAFDAFRGGSTATAQNLFLAPGDATVDEMIAATTRGLLITSFHYTRVVEPHDVVITGMTRNGTFLVENGEVAGPVKNLRFTDSYIRALNHVTHVGVERLRCGEGVGSVVVPALRLESLRFTSTTDF